MVQTIPGKFLVLIGETPVANYDQEVQEASTQNQCL